MDMFELIVGIAIVVPPIVSGMFLGGKGADNIIKYTKGLRNHVRDNIVEPALKDKGDK